MENKTFYQEILLDHNRNPAHKHPLPDADLELEGVNPSCGDDIVLQLKIENGMVADGAFHGRLTGIFLKMIQGQAAPEELEELEEAVCLQDVAHMPARVKCAVLGWHTLEELLKTEEKR